MKKFNIYSIATVWTLVDQIIKKIIMHSLQVGEKVTIIPNFFKLQYLQNEGAAFSSFVGMRLLLIVVATIFLFFMIDFIRKNEIKSRIEVISLGMILGGIIGNLLDRILYGYVIDYLSFIIFGYPFAVFNFADIGIVIGIGLLIITIIRREKNGTNEN